MTDLCFDALVSLILDCVFVVLIAVLCFALRASLIDFCIFAFYFVIDAVVSCYKLFKKFRQ